MTVEQELRDVLADRAGHASSADGLADAVVRRVRRGRQRASVVGAALVVGVALVGSVVMSGTGGVRTASTPSAPSSAVVADPVTALIGRWEPVSVTGFDLRATDDSSVIRRPRPAVVEFRGDGTGTLSDGCNPASLVYRIESGGGFSAEVGPSTDLGCLNVPNQEVVTKAVRIEVGGEVLTFYDGVGGELGRYARTAGRP